VEIFARKNFANFATYSHWRKFYLPCVIDCMEGMTTITALEKKVYIIEVTGLGESFTSENFHVYDNLWEVLVNSYSEQTNFVLLYSKKLFIYSKHVFSRNVATP
jgi:hypothetical protein